MSFAIGTMLVVAVAMLGSLTVLPAMLSWLGDRIEKARVPFVSRLGVTTASRFGARSSTVSCARPVVSAAAATGVLLVWPSRR
jgi:RND superfamily putative drug exporter